MVAERAALLIVDMQEQFRDEIERDLHLGRAIEHIEYMSSTASRSLFMAPPSEDFGRFCCSTACFLRMQPL